MKYLILIMLLSSCGGGGGKGGGTKALNSLWQSSETEIQIDLRTVQIEGTNHQIFFNSLVSSVICSCEVTIEGTMKKGYATAENCSGTVLECSLYEDFYSYEIDGKKLELCDSYGCVIYK